MSARGCWAPGLCRLGKSVSFDSFQVDGRVGENTLARERHERDWRGITRECRTHGQKGETSNENMDLTVFVHTV